MERCEPLMKELERAAVVSGADQSSVPGRVGALGKLRSRQGTTPTSFPQSAGCPQSCQHKLLITNNLRTDYWRSEGRVLWDESHQCFRASASCSLALACRR